MLDFSSDFAVALFANSPSRQVLQSPDEPVEGRPRFNAELSTNGVCHRDCPRGSLELIAIQCEDRQPIESVGRSGSVPIPHDEWCSLPQQTERLLFASIEPGNERPLV